MPTKQEIHQQLDDFRLEYAEISRGVHDTVTGFLAKTVVYVHDLSPDERKLILDHPFLVSRKYAPNKDKMLLHYFCCIMDAQCDLVYKQASSYARALAHLYKEAELDDDTVRDELEKHGGVEALRRHVQAVETNAKVGLGVLHLEGDEQLLEKLFDIKGATNITIGVRPEIDGNGGWKRYVIHMVEDNSF